ncbi:MAG: hypothetical protein K0U74_01355 [Alphaproteobacteria bacterium]|nr:hypothetical protein [Alphaproteobacteria bacterium]
MRAFIFAILPALLVLAGYPGTGHAASLAGSWNGSGYVNPTKGKRERVRCRITYSKQTSKVFSVRASCATASNKILQTGEVLMVNASRYVGDFYNSEYDISGRVHVSVNGSRQTVSFSSGRGSGRVNLRKR